ncbi:MAG TPA: glycosyltransferase family 39 protein [Candidatus Acidoferrales bacterium]|nr:glycosyltransferase family 39 protein [Candidatus Acidoferrales bacterium]
MKDRATTDRLLVLALGLLCAFSLFHGLGGAALFDPDEGRNAEVAREILLLEDWNTPHYNFLPRLDKPMFFYWLVAFSYRLFGVSEWAARLPSAAAALGCIVVLFVYARRVFGPWTALWAGLFLATSFEFAVFARAVIVDMSLTFFVTAALALFYLATTGESPLVRRAFFLAMFAAMGFGTLLKGPVGIALPGVVIVCYIAGSRQWFLVREMGIISGLFTFLAIVVPGYAWLEIHNPGFLRYFLLEENLGRFFTGRFNRAQPPYYYIVVLAAGFLPWSLVFLAGAKALLRRISEKPVLFAALWTLAPVALFTLSRSKQPAYALPSFVPLSILAAESLVREARGARAGGLALAAPWLAMAGAVWAPIAGAKWENALTAEAGRVASSLSSGLAPFQLVTLGVLFVLVGWASWKNARSGPRTLYASWCAAMILFVGFCQQAAAGVSLSRSSKEAARYADAVARSDRPVVIYQANLAGLPFYLRVRRPVWVVSSRKHTVMGSSYLARHGIRDEEFKKIVLTPEEFSRLPSATKKQLWIFTLPRELSRLRALGPLESVTDGSYVRLVTFR